MGWTTVAGMAEAGVLTGIEATRTALIVVIAESMMKGVITMKVVAGDAGATALAIGEEEVEVLVEVGSADQPGMAVKRDVPELSNGTGRGKSKNMKVKLVLRKTMMVTMGMCKMVTSIMIISSNSNNLWKEDMITDHVMFWFVSCLYSTYSFRPRKRFLFHGTSPRK